MKLLLVEDDADLARWVMNLMQVEHFVIDWAKDGESPDKANIMDPARKL